MTRFLLITKVQFFAHTFTKKDAMSQLANASATSLNFVGFEEVKGQGMPEILFNQVFIEPNQSFTAGVGQLAAAGFVPGTQSYLKRRQAIWTQSCRQTARR